MVRAGPVSAVLIGPELARITLGEIMLIDRVYMSVRDRNWDTVEPVVSELTIRDERGTTIATFDARNHAGDIDVRWQGTVTAAPDGTVTYVMDGEARRDFDYCRIGFCVLHPAATAAGRPFRADTVNGPVEGLLPELIAPQSIVDGQEVPLFPACSNLVVDLDGVSVTAEFEGDLFEMEDQRNWTDASFKTYCTPIALGYPHRATRGQRFHQVVRITVDPASATRPVSKRRLADSLSVELPDSPGRPGPSLGVGATTLVARALSAREARRLRAVGLDHLRTDIHLSAADWAACLDRAMRDATAIDAALELALFIREDTVDRLPELAGRMAPRPPGRVLVFYEPTAGTRATPGGWIDRVREALGRAATGTVFATGTDGDFAELNRDRPELTGADALTYAMNPQVHAFDEASLVETLATQSTTVATARAFAEDLAITVSPITLRQRFNPAATDVESDTDDPGASTVRPAAIDPRQPSLFAAGWTVGSYAALARAGAASVTYFETIGPRGVMVASGSRAAHDAVPAGGVFPVYHALADLAGGAAWRCAPLITDDPATLLGLAMQRDANVRVLVANMRPEPRAVVLDPGKLEDIRVRLLDEDSAAAAMARPARYRATAWDRPSAHGRLVLELLPYATARIDARRR